MLFSTYPFLPFTKISTDTSIKLDRLNFLEHGRWREKTNKYWKTRNSYVVLCALFMTLILFLFYRILKLPNITPG